MYTLCRNRAVCRAKMALTFNRFVSLLVTTNCPFFLRKVCPPKAINFRILLQYFLSLMGFVDSFNTDNKAIFWGVLYGVGRFSAKLALYQILRHVWKVGFLRRRPFTFFWACIGVGLLRSFLRNESVSNEMS